MTSSLMKDMNSKTDLYRANAIRVLCRITDGGLLGQIERYLKQAVVDKNPVVSSAALVSGIHLLQVLLFFQDLTLQFDIHSFLHGHICILACTFLLELTWVINVKHYVACKLFIYILGLSVVNQNSLQVSECFSVLLNVI